MGLVGLVVGALALTGVAPARQAYQQAQQLKEVQAQADVLRERNEQLTSRLARLGDPAYMEKLAREQLGVVRPGDTAYVVVPAPDTEAPDTQDSGPESGGIRERIGEWIKRLVGKS